jgi:hypothetical protein
MSETERIEFLDMETIRTANTGGRITIIITINKVDLHPTRQCCPTTSRLARVLLMDHFVCSSGIMLVLTRMMILVQWNDCC